MGYGLILPVLTVIALMTVPWFAVLVLGLYGFSYLRTVVGLKRSGLEWREALSHSVFLSLSKFPNLQGMALYYWRLLRGQNGELIEYK